MCTNRSFLARTSSEGEVISIARLFVPSSRTPLTAVTCLGGGNGDSRWILSFSQTRTIGISNCDAYAFAVLVYTWNVSIADDLPYNPEVSHWGAILFKRDFLRTRMQLTTSSVPLKRFWRDLFVDWRFFSTAWCLPVPDGRLEKMFAPRCDAPDTAGFYGTCLSCTNRTPIYNYLIFRIFA